MELVLTEPVPEVVEFHSADWAEKYFSAQSAMRCSRVTLSTQLLGPCNGKFQKKYSAKPRKSQALTCRLGTNTLPSILLRGFIEGISIVDFCGQFLHCWIWLRGKLSSTSQSLNNFWNFPQCAKWKLPLHGPRNYANRTWELSPNYCARAFPCYHAKPKIL